MTVIWKNVLFANARQREDSSCCLQAAVIDVKSKVNGSYLIKLEDMLVPENLVPFVGRGRVKQYYKRKSFTTIDKGQTLGLFEYCC